jgi:hypothetical protein
MDRTSTVMRMLSGGEHVREGSGRKEGSEWSSCPKGDDLTYTKRCDMLWTIFVILLVLWLLGLVTAYTFGGFIHILLVIALVVLVIRLIQGRGPVV